MFVTDSSNITTSILSFWLPPWWKCIQKQKKKKDLSIITSGCMIYLLLALNTYNWRRLYWERNINSKTVPLTDIQGSTINFIIMSCIKRPSSRRYVFTWCCLGEKISAIILCFRRTWTCLDIYDSYAFVNFCLNFWLQFLLLLHPLHNVFLRAKRSMAQARLKNRPILHCCFKILIGFTHLIHITYLQPLYTFH